MFAHSCLDHGFGDRNLAPPTRAICTELRRAERSPDPLIRGPVDSGRCHRTGRSARFFVRRISCWTWAGVLVLPLANSRATLFAHPAINDASCAAATAACAPGFN